MPAADVETLSPELALVDPELAAQARAALPDVAQPTRVEVDREAGAGAADAPVVFGSPLPTDVGEGGATRRLAWLAALIVGVVGIAVAWTMQGDPRGTSLTRERPVVRAPAREPEPTGAIGPARVGSSAAKHGQGVLAAESDAVSSTPASSQAPTPKPSPPARARTPVPKPTPKPSPAKTPEPPTRPAARPAPAAKPAPRPSPKPVVGGGYVFGPNSYFQVGADGRSLVNLTVAIGCRVPVVVRRIDLGRDGSFAYRGTARTRLGQAAPIRLDGRFLTARVAEGTIRVGAPACRERTFRFSAVLS